MAEQQLVDYIQKARQANQTDDQSRTLLIKNGWTDGEVDEAISSLGQPQAKPQPQPQIQPQTYNQPEIKLEPEIAASQPQTQPKYEAKPVQTYSQQTQQRKGSGSHLILNLILVVIILAMLGGIGYIAMTQSAIFGGLLSNFSIPSLTATPVTPTKTTTPVTVTQTPAPAKTSGLATTSLASISPDLDASKITVAGFSKIGDEVAYCGQSIATGKISCYLNSQLLANNYSYKPYWIGISPNGQRVIFLYFDSVNKQYFEYESGKESTRYDGPINAPKFSDDSKSFLYTVTGSDTKTFIILNGARYPSHDKIFGVPTFSADGKYLLYGARDGQNFAWVADPIH